MARIVVSVIWLVLTSGGLAWNLSGLSLARERVGLLKQAGVDHGLAEVLSDDVLRELFRVIVQMLLLALGVIGLFSPAPAPPRGESDVLLALAATVDFFAIEVFLVSTSVIERRRAARRIEKSIEH